MENGFLAASILVVAVGWFVNGWLNRKHEIAKKRMDKRLAALESFLPVFFKLNNPDNDISKLNEELNRAVPAIQIYGTIDEIQTLNAFLSKLHDEDRMKARVALNNLIDLVRRRIRKELGLSQESMTDDTYRMER